MCLKLRRIKTNLDRDKGKNYEQLMKQNQDVNADYVKYWFFHWPLIFQRSYNFTDVENM